LTSPIEARPAAATTVAAPAKINLYLHVTGRRADLYHLLDSLVVFAELGDTVAVAPHESLRLVVDGPAAASLPAAEDNLALRAARLLAELAGIEPAAEVRLTKRLPVAAGIGGGSADAAATLRALAALWQLDFALDALAALGTRLGADVPVCLMGRPAFVGGVGDSLVPAPALPSAGLVLINPGVALATPRVFGARRGAFSKPARFTEPPANATALAALLKRRRNDLTAAARSLCPEIGEVIEALEGRPEVLLARMSGSGATCFAVVADRETAEATAAQLGAGHPGWWIRATVLRNEPDPT